MVIALLIFGVICIIILVILVVDQFYDVFIESDNRQQEQEHQIREIQKQIDEMLQK